MSFNFTRIILSLSLLTLFSNSLTASHMMGADLTFRCLGGNRYEFRLSFYRDCDGIAAPTNPTINISSSSCGVTQNLTLNQLGAPTEVSPLCAAQLGNSTCNGGTLQGVQEYVYTGIFTFPQQCTDWVISFEDGARNSSVSNLQNPGGQNMYVEATLNNVNAPCNSSADFTTRPVPYICGNQIFNYNHGAFDADGDSLVYELIGPRASVGNNIPYVGTFTSNNPMAVTGPFSINSSTGQLIFTPNGAQNGVVVVRVREFRNGVLIATTMRDMQVVVLSCTNNPPVVGTPNNVSGGQFTNGSFQVCAGQTLSFRINGSDGDAAQILAATSNFTGAVITQTGNNPAVFNVTIPTASLNAGQYNFVIRVRDNACPIFSESSASFDFYVIGLSLIASTRDTLCVNSGGTAVFSASVPGVTSPAVTWQPSGVFTPNTGLTVTANVPPNSTYPYVVTANYIPPGGVCPTTSRTFTIQGRNFQITPTASPNPVCLGSTSTLSVNSTLPLTTTGASYTVVSVTPATTNTGTWNNLTLGDDDATGALPLGFNFTFFGTSFSSVFVSSNGFITFNAAGNTALGNTTLPSTGTPNSLIALYWDDLNPGSVAGAVRWQVRGTAPNRIFVVQYNNVPHFGSAALLVTGEIWLFEGSNIVQIHQTNCPTDGGDQTSGIENAAGTVGVTPAGQNAVSFSAVNRSWSYTANATPLAGVTYIWSPSATLSSSTSPSPVATPLTNTTYNVTVNEFRCSATSAVTVSITNTSATATNTGPYCTNSTIQLNTVNGASYSWSGPSSFTSTLQNPTRTSSTTAMSGVYRVTVTFTGGCTATAQTTVTVNSSLSPTITGGVFCEGQTLTASTSGGTSYAWTGPGGFTAATSAITRGTATTAMSGAYFVTVTSGTCSGTASANVTVNPNPTPTVTNTSPVCASSSFAISATGGTSYVWSGPNGFSGNAATATFTNATTAMGGLYTVTVSSSAGCSATGSTSVTINTSATVTASNSSPVCAGSSFGITATGGATYVWSGPNGFAGNAATATFSNATTAMSGTYRVTVTTAGGCTGTAASTVTVNALPTPTVTPSSVTITCASPTTTLTASGAVTYVWSGGQTTASISANAAGTFRVTASSASGCTATAQGIVAGDFAAPTPTVTPSNVTITCAAPTTTLTASGAVSYIWSGGQTTAAISANAAGTYRVTATAANGCTATAQGIVVGDFAAPTPNVTPSNVTITCATPTTTLTANGAISYVWSGGQTTAAISANAAGTYRVTATAANGCTATAQGIVSSNFAAPTPTVTPSNVTITCVAPTTTLTANGAVSYVWSGGQTTAAISANAAGTYTVTATAANGCTATAQGVVVSNAAPPSPTVTPSNVTITCASPTTTLTASGAVSYVWSGGQTTASISANTAGTYRVTATAANGCTATAQGIVTGDFAAPTPTVTPSNVTITCAAPTTTLTASGAVSYVWSGGQTTASISANAAGTYRVTATAANGCTATAQGIIFGDFAAPTPNVTPSSVTITCAAPTTTLTASGAVSYVWSGGQTTAAISANAAGTYRVTATAANGCTATAQGIISGDFAAPTPTVTPSNVTITCVAPTTTLTASGAVSYIWSGGQTTASISANAAGTYTVTATAANGCTATAQGVVVSNAVPPAPTVTPSNVTITCSSPTTTLTASGAVSYVWSGGQTTAAISANAAGTYRVTATAANGCTATAQGVVTGDFAAPTPTVTPSSVTITCAAPTTTLTASGAVSYVWSGGQTTAAISANAAGTYRVTATAANGCTATAQGIISSDFAAPTPTVTPSSVTITCAAPTTTLTASGAVSYVWSGGQTTTAISANAAGTYRVTATAANGCTATAQGTVVEDFVAPSPVVTPSNITITCAAPTTTLTASGAVSYVWSGSQTTAAISANAAGTYRVTATAANGCTATAQGIVTGDLVPPTPTVTPSAVTITCAAPTTTLTASGAVSYVWSGGQTTAAISANAAGTYRVTATAANGCTATAQGIVTGDFAAPTITILPSAVTITCSAPTTTLTASGAVSYVWSGGQTTAPISANAAGTYIVTATAANGCTATAQGTIVEDFVAPSPVVTPSNVTITCAAPTTTLTASGAVSYVWSGGQTTAAISTNAAGAYRVTATAANGCTATAQGTVVEDFVVPTPTVTPSNITITCTAPTTTLTASGAVSYVWSGGQTTAAISAIAAGTYRVTATAANGCTATAQGIVTGDFIAPTTTASNNSPVCVANDFAISVTMPTGAVSIAWTGPNAFSGNQNAVTFTSATTAMAGTYTAVITYSNGCTVSASTQVTVNALPVVTTTATSPVCEGLPFTLSAQGANSYSWTGPNGFSSNNATNNFASATTAMAGTYNVTGTDLNGCTATVNVTETVNPLPVITLAPVDETCQLSNGAVQSTVTQQPITYSWSNGSTSASISGLVAGNYCLTVTTAQGCTATSCLTIGGSPAVTATSSHNAPVCAGSNIQLQATGGVSYNWSGPNGFTSALANPTLSNASSLLNGVYTATVTNASGCTGTTSLTITQPNAITLTTSNTNVSCFGGSNGTANLTVTGGLSPFTFAWSNSVNTQNLTGLASGTYIVTVTDGIACSATTSVVISQPSVLQVSETHTNINCFGGNNGAIDLTVSGGTPSYTITWSNGFTTEDINNLTANSYSATVSDALGCVATIGATLTQPTALSVALAGTNASCFGAQDGAVNNTVSGGTLPYTFSWSNGEVTEDISNLVAGSYSVTVTDANSCSVVRSVTLTEPVAATATAQNNGPRCEGTSATLNVAGIWSTFSWSGPAGFSSAIRNPSVTNLTLSNAGTYSITLTNAAGCSATASTTLVVNALPTPSISTSGTTSFCPGLSVSLTASGGTSYRWENGFPAANRTINATGNYCVTVTNAAGCTASTCQQVTVFPGVTVDAGPDGIICGLGTTLNANAAGGAAPFTYTWNNGLGIGASQNVSPAATTTYIVTVVDNNGCSATDQVVISTSPLSISPNVTICAGTSTPLSVTGSFCNIAWGPSAGLSSTATQTVNASPATTTVYTATVTQCGTNLVTNPNFSAGNTGFTTNYLLGTGGSFGLLSNPTTYAISTSPNLVHNNFAACGDHTGGGGNMFVANGADRPNVTVWSQSFAVVPNTDYQLGLWASIPVSGTPTSQLQFVVNGTNIGPVLTLPNVVCTWSPLNTTWNSGPNTSITLAIRNLNTAGPGNDFMLDDINFSPICVSTHNVTVSVNPAPAVTITGTTSICAGTSTTLTASGATSYVWSNGLGNNATTNPISASGIYRVTATNNGCTGTQFALVTVNTLPTPTITGNRQICAGATTTLTATGGVSYVWSNGLGNSATTSPINASGTYIVTVTNAAGCTATASTAVTVNANPTVSATNNTPICAGLSVQLSANGSSTGSYRWAGPPAFTSNNQNPTITNAQANNSGLYTVTFTDANTCSATTSTNVTVNANPVVTATNNGPICVGSTLQLNSNSVSTGSYRWTGPASFGAVQASATINAAQLANAGTYFVTFTDTNACSATTSTTVVINANPVPVASNSSPACVGSSFGVSVSNPTVGASWASINWSGPNSFTSTSQSATITNATLANAGIYLVTTTDINGCSGTTQTSVTVNALPLPVASSNSPICQGFALNLLVNGTWNNIAWSGPNAFTSTIANPTIANAQSAMNGVYSVTVTDGNGCVNSTTTTVTVNTTPVVSASNTGAYCPGQTVQLNATGGTTFRWVGPNGFVSNLQNPQIANAFTNATGNYIVTVIDANGCQDTASTNVLVNPTPVVLASNNGPVCEGASLSFNVAPPAVGTAWALAQWSGPNSFVSNSVTPTISPVSLAAIGTYLVTLTDVNGCSAIATTNAQVRTNPTIITGNSSPACVGTNVTLTSSGGIAYAWSGPNGFTSAASNLVLTNVNSLNAGTYTVLGRDINGCTGVASTTVTVNSLPVVSTLGITATNCNGSSDGQVRMQIANGQSPFRYQWDNGFTTQDLVAVPAGVYILTVTDANQCTGVSTPVTVTQPDSVSVTLVSVRNNPCFGMCVGSININVTGGNGSYTFLWDNGSNLQNPINLCAGTYSVFATDIRGCVGVLTNVSITEPLPLQVVAAGNNISCNGQSTGSVAANVVGGTPAYTYSWNTSPVGSTQTVTGLSIGTYRVFVQDANGCTASSSAVLTQPTALNANVTADSVACYNSSNGTARLLNPTGGVSPYNVLWDNGTPGLFATGLTAGPHAVTLSDANGCEYRIPFNVISPSPIRIFANNVRNVSCFGGNDGFIAVNPQGGVTGGYSYLWNTGQFNTAQLQQLSQGVFFVTVTDRNGCSAVSNGITVTQPQPLSIAVSASVPVVTCFGSTNGALNTTVTGGTAAYRYLWSNGLTTSSLTGLGAGTYSVTVTDVNRCTAAPASGVISQPVPLAANVTATSPNCFGELGDINIDVIVSTGTPNFQLSFDNGATFTRNTPRNFLFDGATAGTYDIVIRDANGCLFDTAVTLVEPLQILLTLPSQLDIHLGDSTRIVSTVLNGVGALNYSWAPIDGTLSCLNCSAPMATPVGTNTYNLLVTDQNGCSATASTLINVERTRYLFIPTAFSPNGDGQNDSFVPEGGSDVAYIKDINVFDRWGNHLHTRQNFMPGDRSSGWDGNYAGEESNPGVYVYFITVMFKDGKEEVFKGDVTLIR